MANIEDAEIYISVDDVDNSKVKEMISKCGKILQYIEKQDYCSYVFEGFALCKLNENDKDGIEIIHKRSIDFAVNVNLRYSFDSYTDNEKSFDFLTKLLKDTKGDFLFLSSDFELVFERRNNTIFANKIDENFPMCSFNDCYELLKTEHVNGYYYNIYIYGKYRKDVNELKLVSYDICKETIHSDNFKIIEYSDIEYAFSMSTQYFNFVIEYDPDKEQENLSEREYVISVNIPFSEEFKDNRKTYAKSFIKNIAGHFEITGSNIFPGYKVRHDKTFEEYIDIALEIS